MGRSEIRRNEARRNDAKQINTRRVAAALPLAWYLPTYGRQLLAGSAEGVCPHLLSATAREFYFGRI